MEETIQAVQPEPQQSPPAAEHEQSAVVEAPPATRPKGLLAINEEAMDELCDYIVQSATTPSAVKTAGELTNRLRHVLCLTCARPGVIGQCHGCHTRGRELPFRTFLVDIRDEKENGVGSSLLFQTTCATCDDEFEYSVAEILDLMLRYGQATPSRHCSQCRKKQQQARRDADRAERQRRAAEPLTASLDERMQEKGRSWPRIEARAQEPREEDFGRKKRRRRRHKEGSGRQFASVKRNESGGRIMNEQGTNGLDISKAIQDGFAALERAQDTTASRMGAGLQTNLEAAIAANAAKLAEQTKPTWLDTAAKVSACAAGVGVVGFVVVKAYQYATK